VVKKILKSVILLIKSAQEPVTSHQSIDIELFSEPSLIFNPESAVFCISTQPLRKRHLMHYDGKPFGSVSRKMLPKPT